VSEQAARDLHARLTRGVPDVRPDWMVPVLQQALAEAEARGAAAEREALLAEARRLEAWYAGPLDRLARQHPTELPWWIGAAQGARDVLRAIERRES
jgi:hypothetical protein